MRLALIDVGIVGSELSKSQMNTFVFITERQEPDFPRAVQMHRRAPDNVPIIRASTYRIDRLSREKYSSAGAFFFFFLVFFFPSVHRVVYKPYGIAQSCICYSNSLYTRLNRAILYEIPVYTMILSYFQLFSLFTFRLLLLKLPSE